MLSSTLAIALVTATVLTLLVALIEVAFQSKASIRACVSVPFLIYVGISLIGNGAATLLASVILEGKLPINLQGAQPFFCAFAGVFAFEGVMSNTNITLFNKGVLTIQDWINKARDPAVARANMRYLQLSQDGINKTANRLQELGDTELNAHLTSILGPKAVAELEESARASHADAKLYKALELATREPQKAASILKARASRITMAQPPNDTKLDRAHDLSPDAVEQLKLRQQRDRDRFNAALREIKSLDSRHSEWHPQETLGKRSELTECSFRVGPSYQRRRRWEDWGDVLVVMENPPNADNVYLLPSRKSPPELRNPQDLKANNGAKLRKKKRATEEFVKQHSQAPLTGYWFYWTMKDGTQRVHVYSSEYDQFLSDKNKAWIGQD